MAELLQHVAHVVVGVGEIGLEHKRAAVVGERGFEVAALEGDAAHQIDGVVIVRVEREARSIAAAASSILCWSSRTAA